MKANVDELAALLKLQNCDLQALQARKRLEQAPEREKLAALTQKREALEEKAAQVESMRERVESEVAAIEREDAQLVTKQARVQDLISLAGTDYRSIETHSKELNGIAKRRTTLEEKLVSTSDELDKIEALRAQIEQAQTLVSGEESRTRERFESMTSQVEAEIKAAEAEGSVQERKLSAPLLKAYRAAALRSGGVAVARLTEGRCGACRSVIEQGHLIALRAEAPLGTCPVCKRLLIVE